MIPTSVSRKKPVVTVEFKAVQTQIMDDLERADEFQVEDLVEKNLIASRVTIFTEGDEALIKPNKLKEILQQ